MTAKRCSQCKTEKETSEFPKAAREKCGLKSYCKDCARSARAKYYAANRERDIARAAQWQADNPEKKKANAKATYRRNHESRRERAKVAYEASKLGGERQAVDRARYLRNRVQRLIQSAERYAANPEAKREYWRNYRQQHPEVVAANANAARARKAAAEGSHSAAEWRETLNYFNHCCAYCLGHESEVGKMTRDHAIPLSRGGSDFIENIVPACRPCNSRKNARTLVEALFFRAFDAR